MVTPAKVVSEMAGVQNKEDILDIISKHCLKIRPKEEYELLKPTLANLFGLEVRFKAQDAQANNDKQERKKRFEVSDLIENIPQLQKIADEYVEVSEPMPTKRNRHMALSRKISVAQSGKDHVSHALVNRQGLSLNKAKHMRAQSNPRARLTSLLDTKNKHQNEISQQISSAHTSRKDHESNSTIPTLPEFKNTALPALNAPKSNYDSIVSQKQPPKGGYVINMDALKKKKKGPKTISNPRFMDSTGPSAEEALRKYYDTMLERELKIKNQMEVQRLKRQGLVQQSDSEDEFADAQTDTGPTKYMHEGKQMLIEIRQKRIQAEIDDKAKHGDSLSVISYSKDFRIKAKDLIMMNVPEKLEYLEKKEKFEKQKQLQSGITERVKENMKDRGMVPADLKYLPACEVKEILENGANPKTQKVAIKSKQNSPDKFSKYNVTTDIPANVIKAVKENVSADTKFEGGYIAEFSKATLRDHKKLVKEYQTTMLNNKITEQGSMYGSASLEIDPRIAELRANAQISKVNSMFEDHKISGHYQKFQEKAMQILADQKYQEEEAEKKRVEEISRKKGIGAFAKKKKRKQSLEQIAAEQQAQADRELEEKAKIAMQQQANSVIDFERSQKSGPLIMGKQKKALETSLDYGESLKLKEAIKGQCKEYWSAINGRFKDDFDRSIMMSLEDTNIKNEILRKIKYQKIKKAKLPNFIRIERERILQQRDIEQRQMLMNQSMESLEVESVANGGDLNATAQSNKRSGQKRANPDTVDLLDPKTNNTSQIVSNQDSTEGGTSINITHASQVSLSQTPFKDGNSAQGVDQQPRQTSIVAGSAIDYLRKKEEMEAKEVQHHKRDFISFCTDVLTQHKMENLGNATPTSKDKHKVLQKVIDDPAALLREEGREPTVQEYGKFIEGEIKNDDHRSAQ